MIDQTFVACSGGLRSKSPQSGNSNYRFWSLKDQTRDLQWVPTVGGAIIWELKRAIQLNVVEGIKLQIRSVLNTNVSNFATTPHFKMLARFKDVIFAVPHPNSFSNNAT